MHILLYARGGWEPHHRDEEAPDVNPDHCEVAVIVVARMTSKRLPGKSLKHLTDRTLLGHVMERVTQSRGADDFLVATSTDPSDDPIKEWCRAAGMACYRGSLTNVALRVHEAGKEIGAGGVVRVSADSPFIDPALIDHAIELYRRSEVDLVTNVFPRTFPKGQSVEVIALESLKRVLAAGLTPDQEEHVTKAFYDLPDHFLFTNFCAADIGDTVPSDHSAVQLSIDSEEDWVTARTVAHMLGARLHSASWLEVESTWRRVTGGRES
jgi:spore coat polysaccharide biosynthesis protein SpsF (cytidylyltransferase family)